jgi:hypothetical protein
MGYFVKSKKINILLTESQQKEIFDIWMNPSDEMKKNNFALTILSPVFNAEQTIYNEKKCTNVKDILDLIGFDYEEKKKGLKLKSHHAKWRHQKDLFVAIAPILTIGSFMTLRGEDGDLIGFFFNGKELIEYSSYEELTKLESTFKLKKDLENNLPNNKEKVNSTIKI